jgi:hypothetical protein
MIQKKLKRKKSMRKRLSKNRNQMMKSNQVFSELEEDFEFVEILEIEKRNIVNNQYRGKKAKYLSIIMRLKMMNMKKSK